MAMSREERRRKDIDETPDIIETDVGDETLIKFLASALYEKKEMENCVRKICEKKNLDYDQQIDICDNRKELLLSLKKAQKRLTTMVNEKNFYCIYGQSKNLWLLFYFVRLGGKNTFAIFYKNPRGQLMPLQIQDNLKEIFAEPVMIVENCNDDLERDNDNYYGPLTVRNLQKVLCNKWTDESFIDTFKTLSFTTSEDVCRHKFFIARKKAKELGTKTDFLKDLRAFIDTIPGKKTREKVEAYETEVKKLNEDTKVDVNKLVALRQQIFDDKEIQRLKKDQESMCVKKNEEIIAIRHEVQRKNPNEMTELHTLFCIVDGCKLHYNKLKACLEPIKDSLQMKDEELQLLYETEKKLKDNLDGEKTKKDEINKNWQNIGKPKGVDMTELDKKLKEVVIGMDPATPEQPKASQEDLDTLKAAVIKIQNNKLSENTSGKDVIDWDVQDVIDWAKGKKGHLGNKYDNIYDAIMVMNRALALDQAKNLRDTQILAIILFFYKIDKAGKLCQIKTGEGKTIIVSMLAAIRCLQGFKVDVITSNIVLAKEGVEETKKFFYLMNMTVKESNELDSYKADVLYGTISKFQFDFLRDLTEGTTIRNHRKFQQVILDEVDSMLVDNGGNIAKISSSFPGMECLRYIYIKIWKELHKARDAFAQAKKKYIKEFVDKHQDKTETEFNTNYKDLVDGLLNEELDWIKDWLDKINHVDYPLIPEYLKEYCRAKKETWIRNAIHAMYGCNENEHYRLCPLYGNPKGKEEKKKTEKEKEEEAEEEKYVAPVDYSNTGVTLTNTIWSNGLHQFVQLKHNTELTFESLTSSFISNIGYIKLYPTSLIFGLTGTLGSRNEQKLLKEIYGVDYAKVPTFKEKNFKETKGLVVDDSSWAYDVVSQIKEIVKDDRPILVICQTLKDLHLVKETLEKSKNSVGYGNLRIFDDENNPTVITASKVDKKEVVISTNLAGRGTNLKTEPSVEKKGGLHVCVTFLPCNVRVEEQAFGRTSRQGNAGTANLIVRQSEIDAFEDKSLVASDSDYFVKIKIKRDQLEQERIDSIREKLVPDLTFKDTLFTRFSKFCDGLQDERNDPEFKILIKDLKEYWAFWLEKRDYKEGLSKKFDPHKEFETFKASAVVNDIINRGRISHNPYYCLKLADLYYKQNKTADVAACLKRVTDLEPKGVPGSHLRSFVLTIEGANLIFEKCKQLLKDIFGVSYIKSAYKEEVEDHLKQARSLLNQELEYNKKNLDVNSLEFRNILQIYPGNSFMKHIFSRMTCLQLHISNIDSLLKQCAAYKVVDFEARIETNMVAIGKAADLKPEQCKKYFTNTEVMELHDIGVDTIYSLREIKDIQLSFITLALAFIAAGIACLAIGLVWLPSWPLMSSIAGTLISEGIVDIVVHILNQGRDEFSPLDYAKSKFITIGKAVLSFGLNALIQCSTILQKAVEFCRKMIALLDKLTHFTEIVNIVRGKLEAIIKFLEQKIEKLIEFSRLPEVVRKLKLDKIKKYVDKIDGKVYETLSQFEGVDKTSRKALLGGFIRDVGKATAKKLAVSVIKEEVVRPYIKNSLKHAATKAIKQAFVDDFKNCNDLKRKLKNASNFDRCSNVYVDNQKEKINEDKSCVSKAAEFYKDHETIFKKIGADFSDTKIEKVGEWAQLLEAIVTFVTSVEIIATYRTDAKRYLIGCLQGGSSENNVDNAIDSICTILAQPVIDMVIKAWDDASELKNCAEEIIKK